MIKDGNIANWTRFYFITKTEPNVCNTRDILNSVENVLIVCSKHDIKRAQFIYKLYNLLQIRFVPLSVLNVVAVTLKGVKGDFKHTIEE